MSYNELAPASQCTSHLGGAVIPAPRLRSFGLRKMRLTGEIGARDNFQEKYSYYPRRAFVINFGYQQYYERLSAGCSTFSQIFYI